MQQGDLFSYSDVLEVGYSSARILNIGLSQINRALLLVAG